MRADARRERPVRGRPLVLVPASPRAPIAYALRAAGLIWLNGRNPRREQAQRTTANVYRRPGAREVPLARRSGRSRPACIADGPPSPEPRPRGFQIEGRSTRCQSPRTVNSRRLCSAHQAMNWRRSSA